MMDAQMFKPDEDGVYAVVRASQPRRWIAYGMQCLLGVTLIYTALAFPPALHWLVFLIGFGVLMLYQAERLRRATQMRIILTETDLRDSDGTALATLAEIVRIDRGTFAVKPSHGFTVITRTPAQRAWAPGLWWRVGRRVGVGGVTGSGSTKFMAEQLALRVKNTAR